MNSTDPFATQPLPQTERQKQIVMANVRRWRQEHAPRPKPGVWQNPPRIILKKQQVVVAVDAVMGKESK